MLLVDKYRPKTLDKCDYHKKLSTLLTSLADSNDFPHILLYFSLFDFFFFFFVSTHFQLWAKWCRKENKNSGTIESIIWYEARWSNLKSRIYFLGERVEKVKTEQRTIKIPNKTTTLTITTTSSAFHIEMNPSECGNQDRVVIQEIIKEIAQSKPLETTQTTKPFKGNLAQFCP